MIRKRDEDEGGGGGFRRLTGKVKSNPITSFIIAAIVLAAVYMIAVDIG